MFRKQWKFRVRHILEAIERIRSFTQGLTFEEFRADPKTLYAVAFAFAVIGEASTHIPEEIRKANPEIPWNPMIRMRNMIIHGYEHIDAEIVWKTVQADLPSVIINLQRMLRD